MIFESTKHKSSNVFDAAFDAYSDGARGDLHVRFHDGKGNVTVHGFYKDAPKALYNAMLIDRSPGGFVHKQLKAHFEWVVVSRDVDPEIAEAMENPRTDLPDLIVIPADTPNEESAIAECLDSQRVKEGLF